MKAYIVKYALTAGIREIDAYESPGIPGAVKEVGAKYPMLFFEKDWRKTRDEAVFAAIIMRDKKIKSLKKQIERLESLDFTLNNNKE